MKKQKKEDMFPRSSLVKELAMALLPFYPDEFDYNDIHIILTKAAGVFPDYHLEKSGEK